MEQGSIRPPQPQAYEICQQAHALLPRGNITSEEMPGDSRPRAELPARLGPPSTHTKCEMIMCVALRIMCRLLGAQKGTNGTLFRKHSGWWRRENGKDTVYSRKRDPGDGNKGVPFCCLRQTLPRSCRTLPSAGGRGSSHDG